MQALAREYRQSRNAEGLEVLLVKNPVTGEAAIDYVTENGNSVFFPVAGFLSKPANAEMLLNELDRILAN
jgi:hypothetical protein